MDLAKGPRTFPRQTTNSDPVKNTTLRWVENLDRLAEWHMTDFVTLTRQKTLQMLEILRTAHAVPLAKSTRTRDDKREVHTGYVLQMSTTQNSDRSTNNHKAVRTTFCRQMLHVQ